MSRASPANRADSILSPLWGLKYSEELKLKGIAALSNTKACHQASPAHIISPLHIKESRSELHRTARIVSSFAKTDHSLKDHWIMLVLDFCLPGGPPLTTANQKLE